MTALAIVLLIAGSVWFFVQLYKSHRFWRRERGAQERRKALRLLEQYHERQRRTG